MRRCYLILLVMVVLTLCLAVSCAARYGVADLVVTADGSVYVLDSSKDELLKFDKERNLVWCKTLIFENMPDNGTKSFRTGSTGLLQPCSADGTPQNPLVLSSLVGIREVTPEGTLKAVPPSFTGFAAVDDSGRLYHPNAARNRIERYTKDAPKPVQLDHPGLRFASGQSLPCDLVIDGSAAGPAHLGHPRSVSVSPAGDRIWVMDQTFSFKIFDGLGKYLFTVKAPDKLNRAFTLTMLKFDGAGNTYISSAEKRCIYKYDSSGKLAATVPVGEYNSSLGLDKLGRLYVFHQDERSHEIRILDESGKRVGSFPVPE